jgi:hypothetical protein
VIPDKTRRTYAAMLSAPDEAAGAVLGKIREAGLEHDALGKSRLISSS